MNESLFSHSTLMVQTVNAMLRKTKRNVVRRDIEDIEDEDNNLIPSEAAEPIQLSVVDTKTDNLVLWVPPN